MWGRSQARRGNQSVAGSERSSRCCELVDPFCEGVARILEENDLQKDICVEELDDQKDNKENIGSRLYSGAEIAVEKDRSNDACGEQAGNIPSEGSEHAEDRGDEVENERVANDADGLDHLKVTSFVIMNPPKQLKTVG